jgi:hypothetical protein
MTPLAIGMDIFLAVLLIAALAMGVRLNARLKALRESYHGFAKAIVELNEAASRAESGLAALREATGETHDSLLSRIETARSLAGKLDGQIKVARGLVEGAELQRAVEAATYARTAATAPRSAPETAPEPALPPAVLKLAERFGVIRNPGRDAASEERAPVARRDGPQRPAAPSRRRNDFEDELFAPEGVERASPRRDVPAPQLRTDRYTPSAIMTEDEPPMTLTQVASEDQALEDFAARIRARRAAR